MPRSPFWRRPASNSNGSASTPARRRSRSTARRCPSTCSTSIRETRVALKGPITTPVGEGFRSVNVTLRQALDLYANLRPARSIKGIEYALRGRRPGHRAREHRGPVRRHRAHGRQGRRREHQDHHPLRVGADRPLRLRLRRRQRPAQGHRRAQGQHHEAVRRPVPRVVPDRRGASTTAASSSRTASSTTCACSSSRSPSCTTCWCCPTCTATSSATCAAGLVGGLGVAPGANIGEQRRRLRARPRLGAQVRRPGRGQPDGADPVGGADAAPPRRDRRRASASRRAVREVIGEGRIAAARPGRHGRHQGVCGGGGGRVAGSASARSADDADRSDPPNEQPAARAPLSRPRGHARVGVPPHQRHRHLRLRRAARRRHLPRRRQSRSCTTTCSRSTPACPAGCSRCVLGAALLYHALNGLRIIIIDLWPRDDRLPPRSCGGARGSIFIGVGVPGALIILRPVWLPFLQSWAWHDATPPRPSTRPPPATVDASPIAVSPVTRARRRPRGSAASSTSGT